MSLHFVSIFLLLLTLCSLGDERAKSLQSALKGADKLEITEAKIHEANSSAIFTFEKPEEIAKLIQSLAFEKESPGYCACSGDCRITFYRKGKKLTAVSYHHGISLGWGDDSWDGNSLFTPDSQKSWREWFKKHGEPRFHDWHEAEIKHKKRQAANRNAFLSVFPQNSRTIIEGYDKALDEYDEAYPEDAATYLNDHPVLLATKAKLATSLPDRQNLASVISKALGTMSLRGQDCGSWSGGSYEIELVIETSQLLIANDFQKALNSFDPATLLGISRLFFYGELSEQFTQVESGPIVAKLIEAVAKHDRAGNATWVFKWLDHFSGPEITRILERVALGDLILPSSIVNLGQNLSFPHLSCLLLAKTKSPRFQECLKSVEAMKIGYPDDKLALILARSIRGEVNLLSDTIFDSNSSQICLGALSLFEQRRTKEALDLIITAGTEHNWAAVRESSVLAIERMTGKTWFQNGENERAEWHAEDIREWWSKEKVTFNFPK